MGSVTVIPDTVALLPYQFHDCVLQSVRDMALDGNQPEMIVVLRGVYNINATAFFNA
jgi:hypothetical protein